MRSILRLVPIAGLLAGAACSDSTDPEVPALTRAEAAEIAAAVGATGSDALGVPSDANAARVSLSTAAADPFTLSRRIDLTAPCPLGGAVDIDGTFDFTVDVQTQSGSLDTEADVVHRGCVVRVEAGSITLDGQPGLTATSEYAWEGGEQTVPLRVAQSGAIAWTRDSGESGDCELDLLAVTDLAARTRTVQGTVCGFEIDDQVAWNPGG